ncbi:MAG: DUF11 domain-containing protein [Anaerolineae bacterium]|nr:DUF11 domain-containing protein [Anaerolineae bacterium]
MKTYKKTRMRRPAWALLAGTSALLLTACLSLLLSHFQALAQPAAEVAQANLDVYKDVNTAQAEPGDVLTYTITVLNTGGDPVYVWLTDTLPVELTYATGSLAATVGTFGVENGVITWSHTLGGQACITFSAAISSEITYANIENTAQVTGTGELIADSAETLAQVAETDFYQHLPIISLNYPPRPELNDIPAPGANNYYTVSWSSVSGADRYVLQEATDTNFTSVTRVFTATETSQVVSIGSSYGTLYYRVRADDDDRWGQGPWSDPESVEIPYFDDFSDSGSGWPKRATEVIPETDSYYRLRYENSQYRIMIDPGGPDIWFHHPDALAPYRPPSDKYCVETMIKLEKNRPPYEGWDFHPYWANGGLVFGANEANTNIYALCVSVGADAMGWFIMNNPEYDFPHVGCAYQDGSVGGEDAGALAIGSWHLIQIGVNGDRAKVYIDGEYKGRWTMDGLSGTTRVGLIGGDYEITPVDFRFDNFKVIPNAGCTTP